MRQEQSGLTRRDLLRQSVSTVAAASAVYGLGGASAFAGTGTGEPRRTIAALVDVVGADPVIGRSEQARAEVTRELVAMLDEAEGPVRKGLEAMFGAVDRTVEGRPFADAEPGTRRKGLRKAIHARPEERDLVVRSIDAVVAAFESLHDPTAGRYFGMYPLPQFITAG